MVTAYGLARKSDDPSMSNRGGRGNRGRGGRGGGRRGGRGRGRGRRTRGRGKGGYGSDDDYVDSESKSYLARANEKMSLGDFF